MEQFVFPTAEKRDIGSRFLNQSCVLLRNFVDTAALDRAYDMTLKAYARVDGYHIHPDHLRALGLPMYSDILFGARHFDLLREVFGDRDYEISADTSARRGGRVRAPPHWLPPLGPHLDAFVHPPRFTVNFWIPFQECGIDAPGLAAVQAPFADVLEFAGYRAGRKIWDDPEPRGSSPSSRRGMKGLHATPAPVRSGQIRNDLPAASPRR